MPNPTMKAKGFDANVKSRLWRRASRLKGRNRDLSEYNEYERWRDHQLASGTSIAEVLRLAELKYFGVEIGPPQTKAERAIVKMGKDSAEAFRELQTGASLSEVDELVMARWVFANAKREWGEIDPAAVPSRGCLVMLEWANEHYEDFVRTVYVKCLPSRSELGDKPVESSCLDEDLAFLDQVERSVAE